jgi:hypothetical protein
MTVIQETFLETDWEDAAQARAARDQRVDELQAQGLVCTCETLYRITDGYQVFFLEARDPDRIEVVADERPRKKKSSSRRPRPGSDRKVRDFEQR